MMNTSSSPKFLCRSNCWLRWCINGSARCLGCCDWRATSDGGRQCVPAVNFQGCRRTTMVVGSSRKMMIVVWISIKTAVVIVESSDISGQWTFLHEITKYDESYQGLLFHLLRNLWIETPDFSPNSPNNVSIGLGPWRCTGSTLENYSSWTVQAMEVWKLIFLFKNGLFFGVNQPLPYGKLT